MTQSERSTLIEWLCVITGAHHSFWQQYDSDVLCRLYEKTLEEHQTI